MALGVIEEPFRVFLRRDGPLEQTVTLRFVMSEGMGMMGMRRPGRPEPTPVMHYEDDGIDAELLRASRFVQVFQSGQRQSFALSRLNPEIVARLPADAWVELKPLVEFGFRYLVPPDEFNSAASAPSPAAAAAVAVTPPPRSSGPASSVPQSVPRSNPAIPASPTPARPVAPPPPAPTGDRPVPVTPALADKALDVLTRDQAIEYLKAEMQSVEDLHRLVEDLERRLEASRARERDLLEVLGRWQQRE